MGIGTYERPQDARESFFASKTFSVGELSIQEKNNLFHAYGFRLADVCPILPSQKWFFSAQEFVSPEFYIQTLYKVKGTIEPKAFSGAMNQLIASKPILRTNFYQAGERVLRIVLGKRDSLIVYHTLEEYRGASLDQQLEKLMAADRRHGFDLMRDLLVRIAVFRTGADMYAILVTQPQLIADGWDIRELFVTAFAGQDVLLPAAKQRSFATYLEERGKLDLAPARQYWKKLLSGLPLPGTLPGYAKSYQPYSQQVRRVTINLADMQRLQEFSRGERSLLAATLQTAWGFFLQQMLHTEDACFCLMMPERRAQYSGRVDEAAVLLNVLPLRLRYREHFLVQDAVKRQLMQALVSQPFSYCRRKDYNAFSGRSGELFDHFLSFHGFLMESQRYSKVKPQPGVQAVTMESMDAQGMDLGVYFHYDEVRISADFVYNENCFRPEAIEYIGHKFAMTLHQLLLHWEDECYILYQALRSLPAFTEGIQPVIDETELVSFLQQQPIFAGLGAGRLHELATSLRVEYHLEDDRVLTPGLPQTELFLVMHGKVARSREAAGGWLNVIDIAAEGAFLNEYAMLEALNDVMAAEVVSDTAVVLAIPVTVMHQLMANADCVREVFLQQVLRELDKYQRRWLME